MSDSDSRHAAASRQVAVSRRERLPWLNVPNLLCLTRLLGSPVLAVLAVFELRTAFVSLLLLLLLTDWLDGKLAVRWRQQTQLGARLDSLADAAMYGALLFGVAWFFGPIIRREAVWPGAVLVSYAATNLAGWWKFGRLPSYHTRAAKSCWLLVMIATLAMFAGWSVLPLRIACAAVVWTNIEAIAITCVLPRWKVNVPSLYHAWQLRRNAAARSAEDAEE